MKKKRISIVRILGGKDKLVRLAIRRDLKLIYKPI